MWLAAAAVTAVLPMGCGDKEEGGKSAAVPEISLVGADIDQVHEIEQGMTVQVNVAAGAGIEEFTITIDSPALTDEMLGLIGLASRIDLVEPATDNMAAALREFGFPVGDAVKNAKNLTFDMSMLVPLIKTIYPKTGDHVFTLSVTDNKAQQTAGELKFHTTGPTSVVYNDDADLWANTATLKVQVGIPDEPALEYKKSNETEWQKATLTLREDGSYTAVIEPAWKNEGANAAGNNLYSQDGKTGVFAGYSYDYRLINGGNAVADCSGAFTAAAGDVIPNGKMADWSKKEVTMGNTFLLSYPNAAGQSFWDSGNNPFLENPTSETFTPLCEEDKAEAGVAALTARMVLGFVFAPGNLFVGDFNYSGMSGTAAFGKTYGWTARPRAMKVRYKAEVGAIDRIGSYDPLGEAQAGQPDRSRIFVAVVDWSAQHGVESGMVEPSGMWDPAVVKSVDEGNFLGYGDLTVTQSTTGWTEVTLPIKWYVEKAGKPAADKISLVISCATSVRGDYLTGCSTNVMKVDDFEWVY